MQRILVQLQQINAAVTNNYTYYTVSSYFQLAQAYDMNRQNSTHVSLIKVLLWQLFFGWLEIQTDIVPPNSASNAFAFVAVQNGVLQAAPNLPVQ